MWLENWFPFYDVEKTLDEMDRLFGSIRQPMDIRSVPRGTFPAVNIYEQDDHCVVVAEIPGVDPDSMDLSVQKETLTLKVQRREEPDANARWYRRERVNGQFQRTITLPAPVNTDTINAEYKNGILRVSMEKAKEAKMKKITIKS